MKAPHPTFNDSELYFMEDIILEDQKRWKDKFSHSPDFEEVNQTYESIIAKLKAWKKEEFGWSNAIRSLMNNSK